jgi:hypothetical protein
VDAAHNTVNLKPCFLEISAVYISSHLDFGVPTETKHNSVQEQCFRFEKLF